MSIGRCGVIATPDYSSRETRGAREACAWKPGREFPAVFAAIVECRLHMTGALLLAPHLTADNFAGLLEVTAHKTKEDIELLLAHRFPRQDVPERVQPINPSPRPLPQPESPSGPPLLAPEDVASDITHAQAVSASLPAPERVPSLPLQPPSPPARVTPLAPERFAVQFTMSQAGRAACSSSIM